MIFNNMKELNESFVSGKFKPVIKTITIDNDEYTALKEFKRAFVESLETESKYFITYKNDVNAIVFVWECNGYTISPLLVEKIDIPPSAPSKLNEITIPDIIDVVFTRFDATVKGRVDTGAKMTSLHAEKYDINERNRTVTFMSNVLKPGSKLTMPYVDVVSIQTSEGKDDRPVVILDIIIGDEKLERVKVNLNDRSEMDDKLLIGQNVLEQGNFLVDPNVINDDIDNITYDMLSEMYNNEIDTDDTSE